MRQSTNLFARPTAAPVDRQALLAKRIRDGAVAVLVGLLVFTLFDFALPAEQRVPMELLRGALAVVYLIALVALRGGGRRYAEQIGIVLIAALSAASSASGLVIGDARMGPSIATIALLAAAAFYPWSIRAQAWAVALSLPAAAWNAVAVGGLAGIPPFATATLVVSAGFSLYLVWELQQQRSELERSARMIEESAATFREIIATAPDGIVIRARDDDTILAVNDAWVTLTGYSREELVGRSVAEVGIWARSSDREAAMRRMDEEGAIIDFQSEFRRKDGTIVPIGVAARSVTIAGKPFVMAFVRNVAERRDLERMRQEIVAMLSHDIKNPLGAILGYVEELADEVPNPSEDVRHILDRVQANARAAVALADNFVQAAKIESGQQELHRRPTTLDELVKQALTTAEGLARVRGLRVVHRSQGPKHALSLDPGLMDRVVGNLLGNAIKFAPKGSEITVETAVVEGAAVLRVRDQGPGIPEEARTRLFQRFRRGPSGRLDGSGLGLYIVRSVVEAHGGRVGVECPPEGGSVFEIAFPLVEPAAESGQDTAS